MGQYSKAIITAAGQSLIARAIAGEAQLNITKAKTSDYKFPDDKDYKALTDMEGIKQVLEFPETKVLGNDLIQTRVLFSNEEIKATYYIHNIGLYANDGTKEVLFCIVTADMPDEMPQYNGVAATSYIYNIQNVVKDAETIHITVSQAGNATIQDVMDRVNGTGGDISETVIGTLEPIDTKYPVPSAGESTKVFMGKVKKYIEDTKPLDEDMMIYVSPTGNDTTGTGEHSSPFKTINYALSTIPKVLNGNLVTINLEEGVYDEHVFIYGFTSGALKIQSTTPDNINTNCVIQSILVQYCYAFVDIHGVTMNEPETTNAIGIEASNNVSVSFVRIISVNGTKSCIVCSKSVIAVFNCELSNHKYAIYANDSKVRSRNNIGTGNSVALASTGGAVFTQEGMQPTGNVPYDVYEGSTIISPYGAKIGTLSHNITLFVSTTGSDITGDGTSEKPFKTIGYAINTLPRDLGGYNANINIATGTYDEDLFLVGIGQGGTLTLFLGGNVTVRSISIEYSNIIIRSSNDSVARTLTTKYVFISNSSSFNAYATISITTTGYLEDGSNKYSIFIIRQSSAYLSGSTTLTGNTGTGVAVANTSKAYFYSINGSGFTTGLDISTASHLTIYSNTISATLPTSIYTGGQLIFNNGTQISGFFTAGLSCTWANIRGGGYVRHGVFSGGVAMVTVDLNMNPTSVLTSGQRYSIAGFPRPSNGYGVAVYCHADYFFMIQIDANGVMILQPSTNINIGATFTLAATYLTNS
jgi:hypothetical protein